jgi:hypothetical protein
MKIPRDLPKQKEYAEAIRIVMVEYLEEKHKTSFASCALCRVSGVRSRLDTYGDIGSEDVHGNCVTCPHVIFLGKSCLENGTLRGDIPGHERIYRLAKWLRRYERKKGER